MSDDHKRIRFASIVPDGSHAHVQPVLVSLFERNPRMASMIHEIWTGYIAASPEEREAAVNNKPHKEVDNPMMVVFTDNIKSDESMLRVAFKSAVMAVLASDPSLQSARETLTSAGEEARTRFVKFAGRMLAVCEDIYHVKQRFMRCLQRKHPDFP